MVLKNSYTLQFVIWAPDPKSKPGNLKTKKNIKQIQKINPEKSNCWAGFQHDLMIPDRKNMTNSSLLMMFEVPGSETVSKLAKSRICMISPIPSPMGISKYAPAAGDEKFAEATLVQALPDLARHSEVGACVNAPLLNCRRHAVVC